jgi:cell shape-determining protein MreD
MKTFIKLFLVSLALALITSGISLIGNLNLIWIAVIALFVAEFEYYGVVVAVVAGGAFDIMMGDNVGLTGFAVLVALTIYVLIHGLGLITSDWQKILSIFVIYVFTYAVEFLVKVVLGELNTFNVDTILFILRNAIPGVILTIITFTFIQNWKKHNLNKATVKL